MTSQLPNGLGSGSVIAVDFSALGDPQSWQLWRSVLRAAFGLELDADVRLRSIRLSQWFQYRGDGEEFAEFWKRVTSVLRNAEF